MIFLLVSNLYDFSAIRACVKGGKTERALSLFQVGKDKGLVLDSYFYTAAIEACDWSQALKLLDEMETYGIPPSEVAYSVTIKACGNGGQWQKALDLLESMRQKNMSINIYNYNAAISAISKAAKQGIKSNANDGHLWTEVMKLLSMMRSDGIEPDGFSFSAAISCCGSEGRWQEALQLIEEMRSGGPNIQPNQVAYTAAISSCGRAGQIDAALGLFRQMQSRGHTADIVAYNALFSALRVANRSEAAFELWNEMLVQATYKKTAIETIVPRSNRLRPDIITVTE
jgi:pentatricopeptide repeat domain-containing protein 1